MTTPLQQAVTALMEKIDDLGASPMDWPELFAVSKALEAEQAQAGEPIGYVRHADKTFWPHPECAVYASVSPSLAPVYAHPSPPVEQAQAVEPTLTTKTEQIAGAISRHISTPLIQREVLAAAQYIAHRYAHPVPPPAGERAELVTALLECLAGPAALTTREATAIKDAADMLEADVSFINEGNKAQQVAVPDGWALVPIEPTEEMIVALMCTGLRHAEYRHGCDPTIAHMAQGYTAMLAAAQGAKLVTQQVAVPMTEAQIFACDPVPHVMFDQQRIDFARAIEAFHGIGAKP